MKKFSSILVLLFFGAVYGQEIQVTGSFGLTFLGPQEDIRSQMTKSGFNDRSPDSWFGSGSDHPTTTWSPVYDVEAAYFFKPQMGISLNFGRLQKFEVDGYDEATPSGNYLFLNNKINAVSLHFNYRSVNKMHQFFAGPALIMHLIRDESAGNNSEDTDNSIFGLSAGYSLNLLNKKSWFIGARTGIKWAPASSIGPFVSEQTFGFPPNEVTNRSEFPETDVSMFFWNVGIVAGIRLPVK